MNSSHNSNMIIKLKAFVVFFVVVVVVTMAVSNLTDLVIYFPPLFYLFIYSSITFYVRAANLIYPRELHYKKK